MSGERSLFFGSCPVPVGEADRVVLGHGSGRRLSHRLLEEIILPAFANPILDRRDDQAVLDPGPGLLAFSTDSFVVTPLFFPGATSDLSPSTARSTIWPCRGRGRASSRWS